MKWTVIGEVEVKPSLAAAARANCGLTTMIVNRPTMATTKQSLRLIEDIPLAIFFGYWLWILHALSNFFQIFALMSDTHHSSEECRRPMLHTSNAWRRTIGSRRQQGEAALAVSPTCGLTSPIRGRATVVRPRRSNVCPPLPIRTQALNSSYTQ